MSIQQYYLIIKEKIEKGEFRRLANSNSKNIASKEECSKNSHLEAIHYIIYEFMKDKNDKRVFLIFDYICQPIGIDNDKNKLNIDFKKMDMETFLKELLRIKN